MGREPRLDDAKNALIRLKNAFDALMRAAVNGRVIFTRLR
jgi:hypothetical protein